MRPPVGPGTSPIDGAQMRVALPVALGPSLGEKAEELERHRGADQRRPPALIERRRHLDDVGADEVQVAESAHQLKGLAAT